MKPIEPDSLQRRLEFIRKFEAKKAKWNPSDAVSIQQALRITEYFCWSALIYFFGDLMHGGIKSFFKASNWWSLDRIEPTLQLAGVIGLAYGILRMRWALETFEQFGPQNAVDLEAAIARSETEAGSPDVAGQQPHVS